MGKGEENPRLTSNYFYKPYFRPLLNIASIRGSIFVDAFRDTGSSSKDVDTLKAWHTYTHVNR